MPKWPVEAFCQRVQWADLTPEAYLPLIERAQAEDLRGAGRVQTPPYRLDVSTALVPANAVATTHLVAREPLILAGEPLLLPILSAYDPALRWQAAQSDGAKLAAGAVVGAIQGPVQSMLAAERVALNFLQRLCGIATLTARYVAALAGSSTRLLDTRKTTPGWRLLEKYAVACGGGWNHRLGLNDRVMLKDNHLAAGGLAEPEALLGAVAQARTAFPLVPVQAEVDHLEQIPPLLKAGVDALLLDNFSTGQLKKALRLIDGRCATEASGGITLERLPELASLGLDFISTGATVHQSIWVDLGLDFIG